MKSPWIKVLGVASLMAMTAPAYADEDVTLEELPAAVRAAVERETRGATIRDIERETENGKTVYEVEYTKEGKRWEAHVASTGEILKRHPDEDVQPLAIPSVVEGYQ